MFVWDGLLSVAFDSVLDREEHESGGAMDREGHDVQSCRLSHRKETAL